MSQKYVSVKTSLERERDHLMKYLKEEIQAPRTSPTCEEEVEVAVYDTHINSQ